VKPVILMCAHPDDIACGMGGTAFLLKRHYKLHVICATKGERGCRGGSMKQTAATREKEERAECRMLGAHVTFLGLIDREAYADRKTCVRVAAIIRRIRPIAVFTLWPIDEHPDHSAMSEVTRKALPLSGVTTETLYYETCLRHQTSQFDPDIFVDITTVIEAKKNLIRCHACQNVNGRLERVFLEQASFRGGLAGCAYAEGFKTVRPWKNTSASVLTSLR
jgi:N-acetylglucosamine malate deacetylase 1